MTDTAVALFPTLWLSIITHNSVEWFMIQKEQEEGQKVRSQQRTWSRHSRHHWVTHTKTVVSSLQGILLTSVLTQVTLLYTAVAKWDMTQPFRSSIPDSRKGFFLRETFKLPRSSLPYGTALNLSPRECGMKNLKKNRCYMDILIKKMAFLSWLRTL